jgi:hypothetical protein
MSKPMWFLGAILTLAWMFISIPFADYSMMSVFDVPNSPPTTHEGLQKLLEDITVAANYCIVSLLLLYAINRRWYLRDYPNWLRSLNLQARFTQLLENRAVFIITNVLLALLGVTASILLWFHVRILGRGLGYW